MIDMQVNMYMVVNKGNLQCMLTLATSMSACHIVREVFLCWPGDILCIGASLNNKQHHNDSARKLSLFLMNVLFAYTRGRSEDSVALLFARMFH